MGSSAYVYEAMALTSGDLLLIYIFTVGKFVACSFFPLHAYKGGGCLLSVGVLVCSHKGKNKLIGLPAWPKKSGRRFWRS